MANPHRGESRLTINGREYTLKFDCNALCELEDALKTSVSRLGARAETGDLGVREIRALLWAGLRTYHHGAVTMQQAGALLDELGLQQAADVVSEAFKAAFEDPDAGKGGADPGNAGAAAGTGTPS